MASLGNDLLALGYELIANNPVKTEVEKLKRPSRNGLG